MIVIVYALRVEGRSSRTDLSAPGKYLYNFVFATRLKDNLVIISRLSAGNLLYLLAAHTYPTSYIKIDFSDVWTVTALHPMHQSNPQVHTVWQKCLPGNCAQKWGTPNVLRWSHWDNQVHRHAFLRSSRPILPAKTARYAGKACSSLTLSVSPGEPDIQGSEFRSCSTRALSQLRIRIRTSNTISSGIVGRRLRFAFNREAACLSFEVLPSWWSGGTESLVLLGMGGASTVPFEYLLSFSYSIWSSMKGLGGTMMVDVEG